MPRHLADLESDFSAIHRIDDITALPGPRFFRLAWRLDAYESAIRHRFAAMQSQQPQRTAPMPRQAPAQNPAFSPGAAVVPATKAAIGADPVLSGLISFG